jgi:rSAM/selenodomain-associated transferase 2
LEQQTCNTKISIIIPALNEAANIQAAIASIQLSTNIEIIVVDGGSNDNTVDIAKSFGVKVLTSMPGRACQMNVGAAIASGEILLFLHADTRLPPCFDTLVRATLDRETVAGAFRLKIAGEAWGLRLVEWGVGVRSRFFQLPYGDQAIFVTKKVFEQIGGFPELPIMEDFELIRRLRGIGHIQIVSTPVLTSARRWLKKGIFQTTLINQIVIIAYLLGVSPAKITQFYRNGKFRKNLGYSHLNEIS